MRAFLQNILNIPFLNGIFLLFLAGCIPVTLTGGGRGQREVLFVYRNERQNERRNEGQSQEQERSVCVSGDFNGWATGKDCLRFTGSRWETRLPVPSGRYAYVFVIDGGQVRPDPQALLQEDDGFGRINSILVVP